MTDEPAARYEGALDTGEKPRGAHRKHHFFLACPPITLQKVSLG